MNITYNYNLKTLKNNHILPVCCGDQTPPGTPAVPKLRSTSRVQVSKRRRRSTRRWPSQPNHSFPAELQTRGRCLNAVYSNPYHPCIMYGIFTSIWLIFMVNVGKYTIHVDPLGNWKVEGLTVPTYSLNLGPLNPTNLLVSASHRLFWPQGNPLLEPWSLLSDDKIYRTIIGKMVGKMLGMGGPLRIKPIYTRKNWVFIGFQIGLQQRVRQLDNEERGSLFMALVFFTETFSGFMMVEVLRRRFFFFAGNFWNVRVRYCRLQISIHHSWWGWSFSFRYPWWLNSGSMFEVDDSHPFWDWRQFFCEEHFAGLDEAMAGSICCWS